ncbi:SusC/RagA family TonB-linked outer membrane protein [Mucilaginibacter daejeonensis]|uniref:SusC/RagA family TonB-linked outer membrane protein n=1 Tax=Mucilaginibacter daejeonensis TaxID=398049 RepID=UPI001D171C6B|nr:SusC/RagA family TonB-linked outer membrane protein [Mucilaginibacter daejeonensis]UEG54999.1 SusC/RagA family TonB-linked outer membrane protein [Mucilaginibacter daejeonensis]
MQDFTRSVYLILFFMCVLGGIKAHAQTDSLTRQQVDSVARYKADSLTRAQGKKISGVLKDAATGKPVSGMNISVAQYSAAISDEKGAFTISVPNYDALLLIKGQDYQPKEVPLKGRNKLPVIILFEDAYNSIYDVAKFPYNTVPLNQTANAVSSVNTQGAWEPTSLETADSYLQGKVAGLNVVRRSGTPNIGANLFLRGFNSLVGTNAPLLVVDGMIYDTFHYGSSIIRGHVHNPYGNIDLRDVQNITVLKDAAASAYGTKGANGVILLSTNGNPALATKIDLGIYSGYNYINSGYRLPMMKAGDYRTYLSDLLRTSSMTPEQIAAQPYFNDNPSAAGYADYHNETDWQKQAFKNGFNQNYNLRVSGGDDIARYVLSLGYADNKGITRMTDLSRFNTRFNADLNISQHFTVNANFSFTYNQQTLKDQGVSPKTNPLYLSLVKAPFLRVRQTNAAGVESPNLADVDIFGIGNPESVLLNAQEYNRNYRFFGNLNFKYQFNRYLSAQTLIGITTDKVRESYFIPRAGVANDTTATAILDSRLGSQVQRLYNIYSDTRINYSRTFDRIHTVGLNLGTRYTQYNTSTNFNYGFNSALDQLISVGTGDPALRRTGGELGKYRWINNYLTANYQLYNKYIFAFNLSADASSRFGKEADGLNVGGVKMAVLPSLSAAWVVSSERFMSSLNFIELLKLRASYGLTGNDDIGNYAARQYYVSQNLLGMQGLVRASFGNPYLQWELNKKLDIGFDASFMQERLSISADYYRNTTSKMLTQETAPSASGLLYVMSNNGGMRTSGVELSVNGRIISTPNLKWDLGFNIATYRNKITALPGNSMQTSYAGATILTQVGMPAGVFYGYKTNGVYTTNAEAAAAGISYRNAKGDLVPQRGGDMRFVDVNGDKIIDDADKQVIGDPNPEFTGGITTGVTYKRFSINALVTFTKGNQVYNYTRRQIESGSSPANQSLAMLNRWRGDGQVTSQPRASYGDPSGNASFSDRWIEDGSYMRLRTLSISYDVPLKYKGFKYLKIYATGNNLVTFTKYLGYDPEFAPTGNLLTNGIDNTLEPQFKTVQLGVRIGI